MVLWPRQRHGLEAYFVLLPVLITAVCVYYLQINLRGVPLSFGRFRRPLSRDAFIQAAIETDIQGPFNTTALREFCSKTAWIPGLVFKCALSHGGIGNVRNMVNSCLRYALESGATGFLTPQITIRQDDGTIAVGEIAEMDYFFDRAHLITALSSTCPQIVVYNTTQEIDGYDAEGTEVDGEDSMEDPEAESSMKEQTLQLSTWDLYGTKIGLPLHQDRWDHNFGDWRSNFDIWMDKQGQPSAERPVVVEIEKAFCEFPVHHDRLDFMNTFGRLFEFPAQVRELAGAALYELSRRFALGLDPSEGIAGDSRSVHRRNGYFGAHLRTEPDIVKTGWDIGSFEIQSRHLLDQAARSGLKVVYLASGSVEDSARFKTMAWDDHSINVTTKDDLLARSIDMPPTDRPGEDVKQSIDMSSHNRKDALDSLTWDQQALIDYLMLVKASDFGGNSYSSFSWQIAIKRHTLSRDPDYLSGGREWSMKDEFSTIYGKGGWWFYPTGMWP